MENKNQVEALEVGAMFEGLTDFLAWVEAFLTSHRRYLRDLSPQAYRIYAHLLAKALRELFALKPYPSRALRQVSTFVPMEVLAEAVGMARRTLYPYLEELRRAGLLDWRGWGTVATVQGRRGVYKAGTVFALKLPGRKGRARVYPEDLRHPWRDLDADIAEGRTAWALRKARGSGVAQSRKEDTLLSEKGLELLLSWGKALTPVGLISSVALDCAKGAANELLARLARQKPLYRRQTVESLAQELARELRDPGGVRFYAWAIWHAFRGYIYGYAPQAMEVFLWAVRRAWEAMAAGSIRKPGAVVVHLLKEQGLYATFRQAPAWRVA